MNTAPDQDRHHLPPVLAIMGPTASGKSALALALAHRLGGEIISVDSAQVYRDMDVGTAKPPAADRLAVPHHLLDLITPAESYSAARFRSDAVQAVQAIQARDKLPILVGGTMLYFKALRDGLADLPEADTSLRRQIDAEAALKGWPALHQELLAVDPVTASKLQPGDAQRIQRALELHRLTGEAPSQLFARQASQSLPFRMIELALVPQDRKALHGQIEQRFEAMLKAGLVDELQALRLKYPLQPGLPSMRSVGYRQAWDHLEGNINLPTLRDRGVFATRPLAKRQLTWLRSWPGVQTFECFDAALESKVLAWLETRLLP